MNFAQSLAFVCASLLGALPLAAQPASPRSALTPESMYFDLMGGAEPSYLGVSIAEIDAARAKALKLPEERGVEITRVEQDSPAEKAGLKPGDVVLEYNRQRIEGMEQFGRMVRETPPGRRVTLQVSRSGVLQAFTASIGNRGRLQRHEDEEYQFTIPKFEMPQIEIPDLSEGLPSSRSGMLGIETEALTPQLSEFFGVKRGVLVRSVLNASSAEKAGIKAGDVIIRIDDADVSSPGQVAAAVRAARARRNVTLKIVRSHHEMTIAATLEDDHAAPHSRQLRLVNERFRM